MTGNLNNMKKLLFVLAFAFIGQQAFSQIYIVALAQPSLGGCQSGKISVIKTDPAGLSTIACIEDELSFGALDQLNLELNSVINLGYKLIEISYIDRGGAYGNGLIQLEPNSTGKLNRGTVFVFAIP